MLKEKLSIIPQNLLYKIPFEVLFTSVQNKNQTDYSLFDYLIKAHDVSYHYSASLYASKNLIENNDLRTNRSDSLNMFIGFAPVFPDNEVSGYTLTSNHLSLLKDQEDLLRSVTLNGKKFNELIYSEWEVRSIIELFENNISVNKSAGYFYSNATEKAFKENIKDFKLIHIASHSFINETNPQISGIVFAQHGTLVEDDGILYAEETYNLDLNAELVVLSSCESGLGKLVNSEGMMALTRGFLYSGAKNIIFSLWKVSDKHTSKLMVELYRQRLSGKTYSESLRLAKLGLIKNEILARPRAWAGFLMIGY
jgi:CHAT domain-containing protein